MSTPTCRRCTRTGRPRGDDHVDRRTQASSVEEIRAAFPALRRQHAGSPVAYFDGPGGTQVPQVVVDAMADHLLHHNGNRRWAYPASAETDAAVEGAREAMADLLGCGPGDVVFGPNMTALTYHLSRTLGYTFAPGDEIVVTRLDHLANVSPWKALEAERGVVVREVPFRVEDGTLDTEAYASAVGPRTKLVALDGPPTPWAPSANSSRFCSRRSPWGHSPSLTGCTRCRTCSRRRGPWGATSWPARRTSSTALTPGPCTLAAESSTSWTCRAYLARRRLRRNGSRSARKTTKRWQE